jgi:hypothetical protein
MAQDKPSQVYPTKTFNSTHPTVPSPIPDPSILGVAFDQLLSQRGVRLIHSKAIPCPNVATVDDDAHNPVCGFCDNNGFIYYDQREIWGTFGSNSLQKTFEAHGVWEVASATVTVPTEYPDGVEADFNTFDKLIVPDFTVRLWEMKEYEPRPGNVQELRYPVQKVDYATSIVGNVQKFYVRDTDFTVSPEGHIVWVHGRTPQYSASTGRGEAISWSYYATPVYIVVQTLRELRITQELNAAGQKVARRLPQSILVKRDFFPKKPESLVNS